MSLIKSWYCQHKSIKPEGWRNRLTEGGKTRSLSVWVKPSEDCGKCISRKWEFLHLRFHYRLGGGINSRYIKTIYSPRSSSLRGAAVSKVTVNSSRSIISRRRSFLGVEETCFVRKTIVMRIIRTPERSMTHSGPQVD